MNYRQCALPRPPHSAPPTPSGDLVRRNAIAIAVHPLPTRRRLTSGSDVSDPRSVMQSLIRARTALNVLFTGAALTLLAACGGSKDTTPPVVPGTVSVAVTPATLSLPVGGTGAASATIVRGGSFTGDVTLAATGAPTGVTVSFGTATLGAGVSVSTVSVAIGSTATASVTPAVITVTASGSGVTAATATLALTVTAASTPSATLSISSATATLQARDTTATTIATVARVGGFTGDLALSQTGAPAGVTVTYAPSPIAGSATTSTISIRSSATAAPGTYPIVISAAGTGITAPTATYTLIVVAVPTLSVSVAPTSTSIVAGASGSATATIVRGGGFTNAVAMTATGAPAGMTVTFTPASIATGSTTSAIAIAVGSGVAANTYPITINATGTGVSATPVILSVVVTAVASGSGVTVSYCTADAPIWLAYQDGNGAWTRVLPNSGTNTYQFNIASGKAGLATVDTVGTGFDLNISYATTAEYNGFGNGFGCGSGGGKTVNGTVANVSTMQFAQVTLGFSTKFVLPITSSAFSLTTVAAGPQDLFASRSDATTRRVDKLILRRALNIADGGTIPVLDFNAAEAFAPASANVTVSGLGADTAFIASLFNGTRGSAFGFVGTLSDYIASSGAKPYDAIPNARLVSGEMQQLFASASTANNANSDRSSGVFFTGTIDRTLALGPVLSTPTVTRLAGGAYSRVRAQVASQTEYNRYFSADYSQSVIFRNASIIATTGYTGGGAWDLSIPDLSAATGWNPTWGLQNGTAISWNVTAQGGSIYLLDANVTDGSTFKSATLSSSSPLP